MNHSIPAETINAIKAALQLRRADPKCEEAQTPYLARKHRVSESKINRLWSYVLRMTPIDEKKEAEILELFDEHHSVRQASIRALVPKRAAQRIIEQNQREIPKPPKPRGDTPDVARFDWAVPTLRLFQDGMIQCGLQYMQDHNVSVAQLAAQQMKRLGTL